MTFIQAPHRDSFGKKFSNALNPLVDSLRQGIEKGRQNREIEEENEALREAGYNVPKGIRNPKIRESLLEAQQKSSNSAAGLAASKKSADVLGKYFGEAAKEIYPHLTEGGKTKFFETLLTSKLSNYDLNSSLGSFFENNPEELQNLVQSVASTEQRPETVDVEEPEVSPRTAAFPRSPALPKSTAPSKSASALQRRPGEEGIPINKLGEHRRKEAEKEEKLTASETKRREAALKPAKAFLEETRVKAQRAQSLAPVFDQLDEAIAAGGADAFSWGNFADIGERIGGGFGETMRALGKAHEKKETGQIRSLSKRLLDEMKDIFGGQVRVSEFQAFLSMLPEIGKSRESNHAIVDVLRNLSKASKRYYDTAQDIIQEKDGEIPENLPDLVHQQLAGEFKTLAAEMQSSIDKGKKAIKNEMSADFIVMTTPDGKRRKVAKSDKEKALTAGYKVAQ